MATVLNLDCEYLEEHTDLLFSVTRKGASSRRPVKVDVYLGKPDTGINFAVTSPNLDFSNGSVRVKIPASYKFVVNTLRNVVLGATNTARSWFWLCKGPMYS